MKLVRFGTILALAALTTTAGARQAQPQPRQQAQSPRGDIVVRENPSDPARALLPVRQPVVLAVLEAASPILGPRPPPTPIRCGASIR